MYYVTLFENNNCVCKVPFDSKTQAINYFNRKIDQVDLLYATFPVFDSIQIETDDNLVLFDYEVKK